MHSSQPRRLWLSLPERWLVGRLDPLGQPANKTKESRIRTLNRHGALGLVILSVAEINIIIGALIGYAGLGLLFLGQSRLGYGSLWTTFLLLALAFVRLFQYRGTTPKEPLPDWYQPRDRNGRESEGLGE
jgi:hypothetical protein